VDLVEREFALPAGLRAHAVQVDEAGRGSKYKTKEQWMETEDGRIVLAVAGLALLAGGHKLLNAELGKLGVPHAVGALLVALALRA
jgi:hypothetical protein